MSGFLRIFWATVGIMIGSSALVVLLFLITKDEVLNNGFDRQFISAADNLEPQQILDLEHKGYYFSGVSRDRFYLSYPMAPAHVIGSSFDLLDTVHYNLKIILDDGIKINFNAITTSVKPPHVFLSDGTTGNYIKTSLYNSPPEFHKLQKSFFTAFEPLEAQTFAIKNYDEQLKQNVLELRAEDTTATNRMKYILEKQLDGIFCTDGMFHFSADAKKLVYIYFYRNEFVVLNKALTPLYKAQTIDTTTRAKLKIESIKDGKKLTFSQPPLLVNRKSCINNGLLYINSSLKADNDFLTSFKNNSTIDTYDLSNGAYLYSFYIPHFRGQKLTDFRVDGDRIIVLYDQYLLAFPHPS